MQNVDPKERPKLYALIAAAVIAFGFVVKPMYDLIVPPARPGAEPPEPPRVRGGGVATAPGPATPAAGAATPSASGNNFIPDKFPPHFVRDPFAPVPDDVLAEAARYTVLRSTIAPSPDPSINKPSSIFAGGIGALPRQINESAQAMIQHKTDVDAIGDEISHIGSAPTVVVMPTPEPPPYTVSGVLIGEPGGRDVAILHRTDGADERRFVVVGDQLENGFKVTAIESDGVRIKNPGSGNSDVFLTRQPGQRESTVTLPLGGTEPPKAK